jgi:molecular chaperone GrpE
VSNRSRPKRTFGRSDKSWQPGNQRSDSSAQDAPIEPSAAANSHGSPDNVGAEGSSELWDIAERLGRIEHQSAEYHVRAAHREAVIDRLHDENQKLRDEVRVSAFDPITADLIRLYDSLRRDAERLAVAGADPELTKLMNSYAEDVELILDRCGLEPFTATEGEPFRISEHSVADTVETADRDRENTIAEVIAIGFRQRVTGHVKRPVRARFYRIGESPSLSGAD